MSKMIIACHPGFASAKKAKGSRDNIMNNKSVFNMQGKAAAIQSGFSRLKTKKTRGNSGVSVLGVIFFLFFVISGCGAAYLYQVNDLATKGYEIKEYEDKLKELEKENKKMKIREVELRSMYNLEKSIQNLNLVVPSNVTYLELKSPMAMK